MGPPLSHPEELGRYELLTSEAQRYRRRGISIELTLRAYAVIGIVISVGSLGYFGFTFLEIALTPSQQGALLVAGISAGLAGFSFALLTIRKQQDALRSEMFMAQELTTDIIRHWARFETLARELLTQMGGEFNRQSPRAMVSALVDGGLISESDVEQLYFALDLRNKLVHGIEAVPENMLQMAVATLRVVNTSLANAMKDVRPEDRSRARNLDN